MTTFEGRGELPHIPDDITLEEFILDYSHPFRPTRPPGSPWLVVDLTGRKVGLEELRTRTRGFAAGVQTQFGIREDDVVLMFSRNHIDYHPCVWGMHRLLARISPCNPTFSAAELGYQLRQTNPTLMIAHVDVLDTALQGAKDFGLPSERVIVLTEDNAEHKTQFTVNQLILKGLKQLSNVPSPRKLRAGEGRQKIAFLSPSSGTTGLPKIIALSHSGVIAGILMVSTHQMGDAKHVSEAVRRYRPGDVCLGIVPLYHIFGILMSHIPIFCGITLVIVPKFVFKDMLESIVRHKINQLTIVPPQAVLLSKDPLVRQYDLTSVRVITCGGASLSEALTNALVKVFPDAYIAQAYGQTEVTGGISMPSTLTKVGYNCGTLLPGIKAHAVKPDGSFARQGEAGELQVKSPSCAIGYWGNDVATRETFVDGWCRTGDLVMFNDREEIVYIDRLKEIIKVNGMQVSPAELEGCLVGHPHVAEVCVVGIPNEKTGEVPLAFVVLKLPSVAQEANELKQELMQYVAKDRARFKHVAYVEFVEGIPRNPSGKVSRQVLRDRALQLGRSASKM
ncbi:acetyl-CoA synthetase-like protein [Favolaschia claudopus]|uniref:Acetyl-CoA synthetase-like protein n=1 Tax=Favolaschia claudopus TaxID=2862362 RepID=A0AAW0D1W0_9AGAR